MKYLSIVLIGFSVIYICNGNPAIGNNDNHNTVSPGLTRSQFEDAFMKKLNTKCSQRDNSSCVMLKLVTYMNRMLKKTSISINDNVELTETRNPELVDDVIDASTFARSARSDEESLGVLLGDKVWKFLHSRSLKWKISDLANLMMAPDQNGKLNIGLKLDTKRALEEGRGKNKNSGPLIGAIIAKVTILGALFLKAVALLVLKALIISKVALLLSAVIAIKKLLSKKHVTYEVVAHPHHGHEHHHHDAHGWGRALEGFLETFNTELAENVEQGNSSQDMAFAGQKPE